MQNNTNLDITWLLGACSVDYVIIKQSDKFPEYSDGDDIDIFCVDAKEMCRQILHLTADMIGEFSIRVQKDGYHTHIDFMRDEVLMVRLDLIDTLDDFKKDLLDGGKYAHLGIRLLELSKHPHKTKHLKHVEHVLSKR